MNSLAAAAKRPSRQWREIDEVHVTVGSVVMGLLLFCLNVRWDFEDLLLEREMLGFMGLGEFSGGGGGGGERWVDVVTVYVRMLIASMFFFSPSSYLT